MKVEKPVVRADLSASGDAQPAFLFGLWGCALGADVPQVGGAVLERPPKRLH